MVMVSLPLCGQCLSYGLAKLAEVASKCSLSGRKSAVEATCWCYGHESQLMMYEHDNVNSLEYRNVYTDYYLKNG